MGDLFMAKDLKYIVRPSQRHYTGDPNYIYMERDKDTYEYRFVNKLTGMSSDTYNYAVPYSNGMAVVQKAKHNKYQYRDLNGNLSSDSFAEALSYDKGFGKVRYTRYSDFAYRDMLGRITSTKSESGTYFYMFYNNEISLLDIPYTFFADEAFCKGIIDESIRKINLTTSKVAPYNNKTTLNTNLSISMVLAIVNDKKHKATDLTMDHDSKAEMID